MSVVNRLYGAITRDRWEIGFVEGGVDAVMSNNGRPKINWMQHDFKDRWFADPFILDASDDEIIVLCEEFEYATAKGRIAELVIDKCSYKLQDMNIVLEEDTHLSFPAIWREKGRIFIYPESWNSGALWLYEYKGRGRKLERVKAICDEAMADAIMTERFGNRWLLSTRENDKLRIYDYDADSQKFVFSKEVNFGKATARNAGDFFDYQGKVYRPAQVCIERYGEATEIQEVICDENGFEFVSCKRLYSPHPKFNIGLHTINSYKGMTVIDVHGWNYPFVVKSIIAMKNLLFGKEWKRRKQK